MTEKNRVLNLISVLMFHAEELTRIASLYGDCMTDTQKEHLQLHKEKYLHYAEQISEGITHLRKLGLIN
jgi:hypothetical protein